MTSIQTTRRQVIHRAAARSVASLGAGLFQQRAFGAPITLRLATSFSNDPNFSAARVWYDKFSERLKANCGDEIVVKFFPDSQLGKESDVVTQLKLGVVDMMGGGLGDLGDRDARSRHFRPRLPVQGFRAPNARTRK